VTRHRAVERSELLTQTQPMLPAVAHTIGHDAIRECGTVGGSLALADPSAQWPLLAVLLDARIDLASQSGRRSVAAADFFTGIFTTAAASGELVVAASFPRLATGEGWGYRSFTRRHGDFAIVAAAATVALDLAGRIERVCLALSGISDRPVRIDNAVGSLRGSEPAPTALAEAARGAAATAAPHDDGIASAAFRRDLVEVLSAGALADAARRAGTQR
jgi:carbon-monoxide dehydrogenase medium subunit